MRMELDCQSSLRGLEAIDILDRCHSHRQCPVFCEIDPVNVLFHRLPARRLLRLLRWHGSFYAMGLIRNTIADHARSVSRGGNARL